MTYMMNMRDTLISYIYNKMKKNNKIVFITADLGSPALDKLRTDFKERFINAGIAEQNLINISVGLALENFIVFTYGISNFLVLRAYEQIKNNISLLSHYKKLNINLIAVGTGLSYDISGPSHHCLEDISLINTLPNFHIFSPSDNNIALLLLKKYFYKNVPKFFRLDSKPLPDIYNVISDFEIINGFKELKEGKDVVLITTGFSTHTALKIIEKHKKNWGLIDIIRLKPISINLIEKIGKYKYIATIDESFINKGGLDSIIKGLLINDETKKILSFGVLDKYPLLSFKREKIHQKLELEPKSIINKIETFIRNI